MAAFRGDILQWHGGRHDRLDRLRKLYETTAAAALARHGSPTAAAASGETGTDAATRNSQTCIDSPLAATAEAAEREHRQHLRSWWLEKFPLDQPPSEEWATAVTVSAARPRPWLSAFVSSYLTLRQLLFDSVDHQGGWKSAHFVDCGVASTEDRVVLSQWAHLMWPPPPPPPPPPQLTAEVPPPPPASEGVSQPPKDVAAVIWPIAEINVTAAPTPLETGSYEVSKVEVQVLFGPRATPDCKRAIVFVAGSSGYAKTLNGAFSKSRPRWPDEWSALTQCIIISIPDSGGKTAAQKPKDKAWQAPPPQWMDDILAWLVQLGIHSLLVGFSRGAAWIALLLKTSPTNIRGALLAGGYHCNAEDAQQLNGARDLLKAKVPVIIVHSRTDRYSSPTLHPLYWNTLLDACNRRNGDGIDDNKGNVEMHTLGDPKYNHESLMKVADGVATDELMARIKRAAFTRLLEKLAEPL